MTPRSSLLIPEPAEYVRASSDPADLIRETALLPLVDGLTLLGER